METSDTWKSTEQGGTLMTRRNRGTPPVTRLQALLERRNELQRALKHMTPDSPIEQTLITQGGLP